MRDGSGFTPSEEVGTLIEMKGAAKLAAPLVKLVFEKIGNDTEDDMVRVLDGLQ